MTSFDCQAMPDDIKEIFFDTYRQANNTTVICYVSTERIPIKNWLISNGAKEEDDVLIKYHWKNEKSNKFFSFRDFQDEDYPEEY